MTTTDPTPRDELNAIHAAIGKLYEDVIVEIVALKDAVRLIGEHQAYVSHVAAEQQELMSGFMATKNPMDLLKMGGKLMAAMKREKRNGAPDPAELTGEIVEENRNAE